MDCPFSNGMMSCYLVESPCEEPCETAQARVGPQVVDFEELKSWAKLDDLKWANKAAMDKKWRKKR